MVVDAAFACVVQGVTDDVRDVLVGESVGNFAAPPNAFDEVGSTQHPQVLADQRLGKTECLDELVDAAVAGGELGDQGNADRGGERTKELASSGKAV
jgi:hypothetical protein